MSNTENLETLTAKELKVIAIDEYNLVLWTDFQANASKDDMLKIIEKSKTNQVEDTTEEVEDEFLPEDDEDEEPTENTSGYEVVTPVKFKGKILKAWDSIDEFDGIDDLVAENIVKKV